MAYWAYWVQCPQQTMFAHYTQHTRHCTLHVKYNALHSMLCTVHKKEWFLPNNSHRTLAQEKFTLNSSRSPPLYSLPPLALVAHVVSSVIRAAFSVWRIFAVVSNVIRGREVAVKLTQTRLLVSHTTEVEVAHWTISFKNTSLFKPDIGPSINSTPLPA